MTSLHSTLTSAEELFLEGNQWLEDGDLTKAEVAFRQALSVHSDFPEALANLGLVLDKQKRYVEAENCYWHALELAPAQFETHLNLATLLESQKRHAEAENIYLKAVQLKPDSPAAWSNFGVLLACAKRETEAEHCYRHALALSSDYRKASFNLAHLLLRQGKFEEGWECLESRDSYLLFEKQLDCPRWRGETIVGNSILIGIEGGCGDMIQFCRYAQQLKILGAKQVTVLCHKELQGLLNGSLGIDNVVTLGQEMPDIEVDYWVSPLSFPFLFQTRLDSIPAEIPYLSAEQEKIEYWAGVIGSNTMAFRTGLVWKGNPKFENDADRSLTSLTELLPLSQVPGVRYFSLQKGKGEDEAACPPEGFQLVNLAPSINDFTDTAAIMMNLDLVITVDTAVAHLAGALGKPCWVMLPDYKTDWRWLADRNDSPWYPELMRLFRQTDQRSWISVIADLKAALMEKVHGGKAEQKV
jgi:Flp pilus assembly protein TadD